MSATEIIERFDWMPQLREHGTAVAPGVLAYDGEALAPMALITVRPDMAAITAALRRAATALADIGPALRRAVRAMRPLAIVIAPEGTRLAACRHYRTKRVTARQWRAYRRMLARRGR